MRIQHKLGMVWALTKTHSDGETEWEPLTQVLAQL